MTHHTILVVDDDPTIVKMVADMFCLAELPNVTVIGLCDLDALGSAFYGGPDVILLDLMLRSKSGIEVARQLRDAGYTGEIVAMSASDYMTDLSDAEDTLFSRHISKPFGLTALDSLLQTE